MHECMTERELDLGGGTLGKGKGIKGKGKERERENNTKRNS